MTMNIKRANVLYAIASVLVALLILYVFRNQVAEFFSAASISRTDDAVLRKDALTAVFKGLF